MINNQIVDKYFKLLSKIFLFLVPAAFLFTFSDLIFPYATSKHLVFRVLVTLAVVLYVPIVFAHTHFNLKLSHLALLTIVFYLSFFIADLFAVYPNFAFWGNAERMEGFVFYIYLILYFILLLIHVRSKKDWVQFLRFYMLFSSWIIIYSLWQWMTGNNSGMRLNTFLNNPIYLAGFAIFHMTFATLLARLSPLKFEKYLSLATVPAALIVMLATGTRGAVLAFLLGILFAGIIFIFKIKSKKIRFYTIIIATFLLLASSLLMVTERKKLEEFIPAFKRFENISLQEGTLFSRILLWEMATKAFIDRPWGYGQEGFNYVFNVYYDPRLWNHEEWFDRVHNVPLDILIQGGFITFMFYVALWLYIIRIILYKIIDAQESAVLGFATISYFIYSLSVFDNLASYVPFIIILAYLSNQYSEHSTFTFPVNIHSNRLKKMSYLLALALLIVSFQYLITLYSSAKAVRQIYVTKQYKEVLDKVQNLPHSLLTKKLKILSKEASSIFSNYHNILFSASKNPTLHKEYTVAVSQYQSMYGVMQNPYISDWDKKYYLGVVKDLSERELKKKPVNFMLSKYLLLWLNLSGDRDKAEKLYFKLLEEAPRKVQLYEGLSLIYVSNKKYKEALEIINKALNLNPENDRALKIKQAILKALGDN